MLSSKVSSDKFSSGSGKSALKTLTELDGAEEEPLGVDLTGSCRGSGIPGLRADLRTGLINDWFGFSRELGWH